MNTKEYILLNRLFFIGIVTLFILGVFFYGSGELNCKQMLYTGNPCSSCGLTRDFLSFIRLDFNSPINKASFGVFIFFVAQIIYRFYIGAFGGKKLIQTKKVIIADAVITFLFIVVVFIPFWN